ncbi:hypothetical protein HDU91_002448, partial [Kappamyces sp. JEL0680]
MREQLRIFIFRRDLRVFDNSALLDACSYGSNVLLPVLPVFIFNPKQVTAANPYFNPRSVRFMLESLYELRQSIHDLGGSVLFLEAEDDVQALRGLSKNFDVKSIHFNKDLSPFARARDDAIAKYASSIGADCVQMEDYTFHTMDEVRTKTDNYYQVFTPFYNTCQRDFPVPPVNSRDINPNAFFTSPLLESLDESHMDRYAPPHEDGVYLYGGRSHGLKILEKIAAGSFKKYGEERNDCYGNKTTHLAAYLKFGCISCREAYAAAVKGNGKSDSLISELYWRGNAAACELIAEFYFQLTFHKPSLLRGQVSDLPNECHKLKMEQVRWKPATGPLWEAWCLGKTGFPFVDAGMRELHATGLMHNRARMIVAMFLTKNLCMDWRAGEQYLAQYLIDYDPAMNNG